MLTVTQPGSSQEQRHEKRETTQSTPATDSPLSAVPFLFHSRLSSVTPNFGFHRTATPHYESLFARYQNKFPLSFHYRRPDDYLKRTELLILGLPLSKFIYTRTPAEDSLVCLFLHVVVVLRNKF